MDQGPEENNYSLKDIGYFRVTPRSFETYARIFSIDCRTFKDNAEILDIGSGTNQEFARKLSLKRPDVHVVSVDPTLALPTEEQKLKETGLVYELQSKGEDIHHSTEKERENRIKNKFGDVLAALAPDLPFEKSTFDYIFDNHAAFMYFSEGKGLHEKYLQEVLRILKPEGKAYIYPLDLYDESLMEPQEKLEKSRKRIVKIIQDLGINQNQYELFEYPEQFPSGPISRLGIKITKP